MKLIPLILATLILILSGFIDPVHAALPGPETPTPTDIPPTSTETPTSTPIPPTLTATPTNLPPTFVPTSTTTNIPPTLTPTQAPIPATATHTPTLTPISPTITNTPKPTLSPTFTPIPTQTPVPFTTTPTPTTTSTPTATVTPKLATTTPTLTPIFTATQTPPHTATPTVVTGSPTPFPTIPPGKTSKIVFVDEWQGLDGIKTLDLFTVNPDGSDLRNITVGLDYEILESRPQWAKDGSKIYFCIMGPKKAISLNVINLDGTGYRKLFDWPHQINSYDVSPDGLWVIYSANTASTKNQPGAALLFKIRTDGTKLTQLTNEADDKHTDIHYDAKPLWSPDGSFILFASNRNDADNYADNYDLFRMRSDGSNLRQLTNITWDFREAVWSPDSKQIAIGAVYNMHEIGNLFLLNFNGTNLRQLTHYTATRTYPDITVDYGHIAWSPDGRQLVIQRGSLKTLGIYDLATGQEHFPLVPGDMSHAHSPDWSPWLPESINQAPTPIPFDQIDTDGDGIPDIDEGEWDQDNDGLPNYKDLDSDGDGILDQDEIKTTPQSRQQDKQPRRSQTKFRDSDDDGIPDFMDEDSDQDSLSDADEYSTGQTDPLMDCTVSNSICFNNDVDGDGQPNYLDDDTDGDGEPDFFEVMTVMRHRVGELPWWLNPQPFFMVGKIQGQIYLPLIVK